jgi:hypothetical protein
VKENGRMSRFLLTTLALAMLAAGCAHSPAHDQVAAADKAKPDYRDYVLGTAMAFDFRRVDNWDSPAPDEVVVWTSPKEAYLLRLFGPCFGLDNAATILLSSNGSVRAGSDAVIVAGERCRIQRIDRLDARRLKADMAK